MTSLRRHFHGERESGLIGSSFPGLTRTVPALRAPGHRAVREAPRPGLATCLLIHKGGSGLPSPPLGARTETSAGGRAPLPSEREFLLLALRPAYRLPGAPCFYLFHSVVFSPRILLFFETKTLQQFFS